MATSRINGTHLFWERSGESGEPLVLVHGSWVDHHNWDAVVPLFSRSFRVLTYDRRGHSKSERATSPYRIRDEVADLASLIEELSLAPAHIVGNSSGGSISLRLAGERPDLFRTLVVNEPPLTSVIADDADADAKQMLEAIKARIAAVVKLLEAGDAEGGVRHFVETIVFGPGAWAQVPADVKKTVIANAPTFLDEMKDPEFFSIDTTRLSGFPHPALLTLGEEGPPFMKPIVERLATRLPRAEVKIFAGAGHEPEMTHPDMVVAAVTEFVARSHNRPADLAPGR